jgi:hypothetical protein
MHNKSTLSQNNYLNGPQQLSKEIRVLNLES